MPIHRDPRLAKAHLFMGIALAGFTLEGILQLVGVPFGILGLAGLVLLILAYVNYGRSERLSGRRGFVWWSLGLNVALFILTLVAVGALAIQLVLALDSGGDPLDAMSGIVTLLAVAYFLGAIPYFVLVRGFDVQRTTILATLAVAASGASGVVLYATGHDAAEVAFSGLADSTDPAEWEQASTAFWNELAATTALGILSNGLLAAAFVLLRQDELARPEIPPSPIFPGPHDPLPSVPDAVPGARPHDVASAQGHGDAPVDSRAAASTPRPAAPDPAAHPPVAARGGVRVGECPSCRSAFSVSSLYPSGTTLECPTCRALVHAP